MRRAILAAGALLSALLLTANVIIDDSDRPETLNIEPKQAMGEMERFGEDVNRTIEKFVPDGKQD